MRRDRRIYGVAWLCLTLGYQLLTFILYYGLYEIYKKHLLNFWLGHALTSIMIIISGAVIYYTIFHLMMEKGADIRYCLPVPAIGTGSCIVMIVLRFITMIIPFWITLFVFSIAVILSMFLMVLAFAGIERSLSREKKDKSDEM